MYVLVLNKQPSFQLTSKTVIAKRWVTQIIAQ